MTKKFNLGLFIVLCILGLLPGLVYLALHLTYDLRHRPGANGKVAKLILVICAVIFLFHKGSQKSKRKNKAYLLFCIALLVLLIVSKFYGYFIYMALGTIFGIVGAVRANRKLK